MMSFHCLFINNSEIDDNVALFLPGNCMYVVTTATEPRHVTIGHQCVILDRRGLQFTGR